jgi:hypothetical protein
LSATAFPPLLSSTAANTTTPTSFNFTNGQEDDDGYQVVGRKRLRGRPISAAAAQQKSILAFVSQNKEAVLAVGHTLWDQHDPSLTYTVP